jgi:hypothetical protein
MWRPPRLWVAEHANREACAEALARLFARIAQLADSSAQLRTARHNQKVLTFSAPGFHHEDTLDILDELARLHLYDEEPGGTFQRARFPFLLPPGSKSKSRQDDRYRLAIDLETAHFRTLFETLAPGIRGWDLPSHLPLATVRAERAVDTGPVQTALTPAALWKLGGKATGRAVVDYFKEFGVNLGWAPSSLRLVVRSPLERDEGNAFAGPPRGQVGKARWLPANPPRYARPLVRRL